MNSDPSALVTRERGSSSSVFTQFSYAASPAALLLRLVRTVFIVLFIFQSFQHLNQDFNVINPKRKFDDYQFCNVFKYTPKSTPHPNLADLFINIADQRTKLFLDQGPMGMRMARWCGHTHLRSILFSCMYRYSLSCLFTSLHHSNDEKT